MRDDADGARMSGGGRHEAENGIDEGPISVEEGGASVDEVLQHGKDVREGSRIACLLAFVDSTAIHLHAALHRRRIGHTQQKLQHGEWECRKACT